MKRFKKRFILLKNNLNYVFYREKFEEYNKYVHFN